MNDTRSDIKNTYPKSNSVRFSFSSFNINSNASEDDSSKSELSTRNSHVVMKINSKNVLSNNGTIDSIVNVGSRQFKAVIHNGDSNKKNKSDREENEKNVVLTDSVKGVLSYKKENACYVLKELIYRILFSQKLLKKDNGCDKEELGKCSQGNNNYNRNEDCSEQSATRPAPFGFCIGNKGEMIVTPNYKAMHKSTGVVTVDGRKFEAIVNLEDYETKLNSSSKKGILKCTYGQTPYSKNKKKSSANYRKEGPKPNKKTLICTCKPCVCSTINEHQDKERFSNKGAGGDSTPEFDFKVTSQDSSKKQRCVLRKQEKERFLEQGNGLKPETTIMNEQSNVPLRIYEISPSKHERYYSIRRK